MDTTDAKASENHFLTGFLGTYASPQSKGIYRFTLNCDNGVLSKPELYYPALNCKYLSLRDGLLVSPIQNGKRAGICLLNSCAQRASLISDIYAEDGTACFVTQDEEFIYTANYHEGIVLIYRKMKGSLVLYKRIEIAPKAGCHQILFHGHFMLVPCLLLDEIRIFDLSRDYRLAGTIEFRQGTGPRHGIFTRDHSRFFVVSELSNELYVYRTEMDANEKSCEQMSLKLLSVHPLLQKVSSDTVSPASAAIRLSPDERYLYISIRFADVISVFDIRGDLPRLIQRTGSGGLHPRDFVITGDGKYLLAANRTENGLVCFPLNSDNGTLGPACSCVPAPEAVSIVLDEF